MSPAAVLRRLEDVAATIDPALFQHPGSATLRRALYAAWPDQRLPLPRRRLEAWCREYSGRRDAIAAAAPPGKGVLPRLPDGGSTQAAILRAHGSPATLEAECTGRADIACGDAARGDRVRPLEAAKR